MTIVYSAMAQRDLVEMDSYISENPNNPKSASSLCESILEEISRLKDSPFIGTPLYLPSTGITEVRIVRFKNFGAFYRVDGNTVYIDRILYLKRDYLAFFRF